MRLGKASFKKLWYLSSQFVWTLDSGHKGSTTLKLSILSTIKMIQPHRHDLRVDVISCVNAYLGLRLISHSYSVFVCLGPNTPVLHNDALILWTWEHVSISFTNILAHSLLSEDHSRAVWIWGRVQNSMSLPNWNHYIVLLSRCSLVRFRYVISLQQSE